MSTKLNVNCKKCNIVFKIKKSRFKITGNYCSRSCRGSGINNARKKEFIVACPGCSKEIKYVAYKQNSTKIRKYCNRKCYFNHHKERLVKQCSEMRMSNEELSKITKKRFSNKENHPFYGKHHSRQTIEKISKIRKQNEKSKGCNNPMYGKNHTTEAKEKMSNTRTERWLEGKYKKETNKYYKTGYIFSNKLNRNIYYRSSWEEKYILYLDANNAVLSFQEEPFRISYYYKQIRNYIPDFLVEYKKGNKEVIEIKPKCYLKNNKNRKKFSAAREYCKSINVNFKVITQDYLKRIGILL